MLAVASQNKFFARKDSTLYQRFRKKLHARETLRRRVNEFLERDDNSRMMPGKIDNKKAENRHMQKRVFNDSMALVLSIEIRVLFTSFLTTKMCLK